MPDRPNAWLKLLGTSEWQMKDAWTLEHPENLKQVRFGSRPDEVAKGDYLVYYAVGWQRIFAVARVTSEKPYEPASTKPWDAQWPWVHDVVIVKKRLRISSCPSVLCLGAIPDLHHKGLVPITLEQKDLAEQALDASSAA